eukprot:2366979-Prymnesium_polylepis.1
MTRARGWRVPLKGSRSGGSGARAPPVRGRHGAPARAARGARMREKDWAPLPPPHAVRAPRDARRLPRHLAEPRPHR